LNTCHIIAKFVDPGCLKHNGDHPVELDLASHKFHATSAPSSTLPGHITYMTFLGQRNDYRGTFDPKIIILELASETPKIWYGQ
jgi:hypothetical protein